MSAPESRLKRSSKADVPPREVELKLELASGTLDELLAHPALSCLTPLADQSGQLHAIYFDTDDHTLYREGISLRIRHRGGTAVQTIKAEGSKGSLAMDRSEWETPVDGELDLSAAAGTALEALLTDEATRESLKPVFTVDMDRQAFEAELDDALIEVALDRAKASGKHQEVAFSEVELELRKGSPAALFAFARRLGETIPLRLSTVTKSERGYRLLETASLQPFRAEPIELLKNATCAEAFQRVARACLTQMLRNEALVRQTQDPASLHQMRVGLRRLRAAISLFGKQLLTDPESTTIKGDLRWAGQAMGYARDLDVLLERITSTKAEYDKSQIGKVKRHRAGAYRDLLQTLESRRFMDVVLKAAAWIEAGDWTTSEAPELKQARDRLARDFVSDELSRRFKRILKIAKRLRKRSEEERHELRIRIKKLRYGSEFFAALFPSKKKQKRRRKLAAILEELQEKLGELHDLAVSGSLVPSLVETSPKQAERRREKLLDKSKSAAKSLAKIDPFWP
ncbi:CYTH and CHAD domain-containing protein [Microvirga zambiensis]|uniref:CYTH and CHAD domain-containing protein n=1 Tax=Microvirga zambiensis TaxID=1402137 RepID=UPI00191CF27B|nr:CYTH and CHAD domain-containing protein [Microvirga zambiensis]